MAAPGVFLNSRNGTPRTERTSALDMPKRMGLMPSSGIISSSLIGLRLIVGSALHSALSQNADREMFFRQLFHYFGTTSHIGRPFVCVNSLHFMSPRSPQAAQRCALPRNFSANW